VLSAFAPLAGKHHQLLVRAVSKTHAQKSVRQDAAFEKSLELVCDKLQQARAGPDFDLGEEGLEMFPHQAVQDLLLRPPPLLMDRVRRGGAQHGFAFPSHPDGNARPAIAGHSDLARLDNEDVYLLPSPACRRGKTCPGISS